MPRSALFLELAPTSFLLHTHSQIPSHNNTGGSWSHLAIDMGLCAGEKVTIRDYEFELVQLWNARVIADQYGRERISTWSAKLKRKAHTEKACIIRIFDELPEDSNIRHHAAMGTTSA